MSFGPEKAVVFVDLVYIHFPLCMVEFQLAFVDAFGRCSTRYFLSAFHNFSSLSLPLFELFWNLSLVSNSKWGIYFSKTQCNFSVLTFDMLSFCYFQFNNGFQCFANHHTLFQFTFYAASQLFLETGLYMHICDFLTPEQRQHQVGVWRGSLSTNAGWCKLYVEVHLQWRVFGLQLRLKDQTAVFIVEEPAVSKTEEGMSGQELNQEHAGWLVFFDIYEVVHCEFIP